MSFHRQHFDARFWGFTIVGTLMASMFGCFAFAIAAHTTTGETASILSVNDALHQMELRQKDKAARDLLIREDRRAKRAESVIADSIR